MKKNRGRWASHAGSRGFHSYGPVANFLCNVDIHICGHVKFPRSCCRFASYYAHTGSPNPQKTTLTHGNRSFGPIRTISEETCTDGRSTRRTERRRNRTAPSGTEWSRGYRFCHFACAVLSMHVMCTHDAIPAVSCVLLDVNYITGSTLPLENASPVCAK